MTSRRKSAEKISVQVLTVCTNSGGQAVELVVFVDEGHSRVWRSGEGVVAWVALHQVGSGSLEAVWIEQSCDAGTGHTAPRVVFAVEEAEKYRQLYVT